MSDSSRIDDLSSYDSEQLKLIIENLQEKMSFLQNIIDYSPDAIVLTNKFGEIIEFSKGAESLTGFTKQEVLGKKVDDFYLNPDERKKILKIIDKKGKVMDYEIHIRRKDKRVIPLSLTMAYVKDERGEPIGTIGISIDIRKRKMLMKKLEWLAHHDSLTGLFNRAYFIEQLQNCISKFEVEQKPFCLVMIDLDGFKETNDREGHTVGDKILTNIGRIIRKNIRNRIDLAFRYGGDEFTIIMKNTDSAWAYAKSEAVRISTEEFFNSKITMSIGVVQYKVGLKPSQLIKLVDTAMYSAKSSGGNKVVAYSE